MGSKQTYDQHDCTHEEDPPTVNYANTRKATLPMGGSACKSGVFPVQSAR